MIVTNPALYQQDGKFYEDLLKSMNLPTASMTVSPFVGNGIFFVNAAGGQDFIFDLITPSVAPAAAASRFLYVGNLFSKIWCSQVNVAGSSSSYLTTYNGVTLTYWPVDIRGNVAAVDTDVTQSREYNYMGVAFSYLRILTTGSIRINWNYLFAGVKITY